MKAYLDSENKIRLFRPDMNMKRMKRSMDRLALPLLDEAGFLNCIKQLHRPKRKNLSHFSFRSM